MSWRVSLLRVCVSFLLGLAATACKREGEPPSRAVQPAVQGPTAPDTEAAKVGKPESPDEPASAPGEPAAKPVVAKAPPASPEQAGSCPEKNAAEIGIVVMPKRPAVGQALTILVAAFDNERALALRVEDHEGAALAGEVVYRTGVPAATIFRITPSASGKLRVVVGRDGTGLRCTKVRVAKRAVSTRPRPVSSLGVWPVKRRWDGAEEALFSAWLRELFHAPRGEDLAWKAMHEVTSDVSRNLLANHYGWDEDNPNTKRGLYLRPDCADAPYFLRAYYAWKRELPFGYRRCSRGRGKAPRCGKLHGIMGPAENTPDASKAGELGAVQRYFRRTLAWGVHSGNGRTAFGDNKTDFYPVELSRRALRPGTIFADPYGHLFVMVEMMDPDGDTPGIFYAIDGQPDGSITRKRFWEGNFLWNPDPTLGGSGFKAFRPVKKIKENGGFTLVALDDEGVADHPAYGDISAQQATLTGFAFYDQMDALVTPGRRNASRAQEEAVRALFEAAKVRVRSVDNAQAHVLKSRKEITMPSGHAIFETTGAWENFSTPARDLRLLIAIDLVVGFESKVARNAAVFVGPGQTLEALLPQVKATRAKLLADPGLRFSYTRSDGSLWELGVSDVIERAAALEMAYNPNDCPEIRWAAPLGSEERQPCRRRAPAVQQRKMKAYRSWFTNRRRPGRGDPGPAVD